MQHLIVVLIVAVALLSLLRRLRRTFTAGESSACGCGCSGCNTAAICPPPKNRIG